MNQFPGKRNNIISNNNALKAYCHDKESIQFTNLMINYCEENFTVEKKNKFYELCYNSHFICAEADQNYDKSVNRSDFIGLDKAIHILANNPDNKIIMSSFLNTEQLKTIGKKESKINLLLTYPNVIIMQLPYSPDELMDKLLSHESEIIDQSTKIKYITHEAKNEIGIILHGIKNISDPYNPQNESETMRLKNAFDETQKFFPGLDSIDKMLDFILNVNLDIPEVMKGQRIKGVYVDIDGTLIDYVGIHSGKEGTQQLRSHVVELLTKLETEGNKIILWTGGNVKMKEAYLKTLGINRPVVSKYDFAGAHAEIVIDDTDQNAFIAQSKIIPEMYINVNNYAAETNKGLWTEDKILIGRSHKESLSGDEISKETFVVHGRVIYYHVINKNAKNLQSVIKNSPNGWLSGNYAQQYMWMTDAIPVQWRKLIAIIEDYDVQRMELKENNVCVEGIKNAISYAEEMNITDINQFLEGVKVMYHYLLTGIDNEFDNYFIEQIKEGIEYINTIIKK